MILSNCPSEDCQVTGNESACELWLKFRRSLFCRREVHHNN